MKLNDVSLSDRFTKGTGRVLANGTQALLISMFRQRRFDRARGFNTAGFLSGYRGSPIASLDSEAERAAKHLAAHDITFTPGINEDLALTSVWGTQQVALDPMARVDGVFGMWYGKGAGLDRCGDALRHAHGAGTSPQGGVLVVCGDDHALKSSSQAYHSEPTFIDMQMPVLAPADLQDILDFSILGWEMSRFSGCYVGFKALAEHVNSTGLLDVGLDRISLAELERPQQNDRWIRWPDPWPDVEKRLLNIKLPAALEFARANRLNKEVIRADRPRLGIVASGKSYRDVLQALSLAGLTLDEAAEIGISIFKIGMPWPADEDGLRAFARGHETLLVVEEKRDLIEMQLRAALYADASQPRITGRRDLSGKPQFSQIGELDGIDVLRAMAGLIDLPDGITARITNVLQSGVTPPPVLPLRTPYFCSGCPHNSSTKVPEGSRALAGVGCHFMATGMGRNTETFTQMGGEGVPWVGTAPFTETKHVFINLGEGTYFHSGSLAIRAALAAGVTATYKILYNDAIAMTGGQDVEGELSVPVIARQLQAEGVKRIEVVADDPSRLAGLPAGVGLSGREDLDEVQRSLRKEPGVSVLIYDQVCATEKRRRRKRGKMTVAPRKVIINERVCEGCGDCSVQSNCLSLVPVETEFGRKRTVDQSSCNQDYSCLEGFCPSFVTVEGAELRREPERDMPDLTNLPMPRVPSLDAPLDIVIAGVGGTGIVTVGALLVMAAHLENKTALIHDKLGMAQKYGAVHSHLRLSSDYIPSVRIPDGQARLLIGGDLRCATEPPVTRLINPDNAHIVVASEQSVGGEFTRNPDFDFRETDMQATVKRLGGDRARILPARHLALTYLGDEIGANLLLLGHAWQEGHIPLSFEAIDRAIEMNGVAVDLNRKAFALGRLVAVKPELADRPVPEEKNLDELVAHREELLTAYQNSKWAARYRRIVDRVRQAETSVAGTPGELTRAAAWNLAKLMSYKDEYEVARLFTDGVFQNQLKRTFSKTGKLRFYLAPPSLGESKDGRPRKRAFGPWTLLLFRALARMKFLRGTLLDPFKHHRDRREERMLIDQYEADLARVCTELTAEKLPVALMLARLPEEIRGYGPVKRASVEKAQEQRLSVLKDLQNPAFKLAAE